MGGQDQRGRICVFGGGRRVCLKGNDKALTHLATTPTDSLSKIKKKQKQKKHRFFKPLHRRLCKQAGFSVQHQPIICPVCGWARGRKPIVKQSLSGWVISSGNPTEISLKCSYDPFVVTELSLQYTQRTTRWSQRNQDKNILSVKRKNLNLSACYRGTVPSSYMKTFYTH